MPNLSEYNPAVKYGANLDVNVDLADIRDANGNEIIELDTVASAVNYVRLANSATGNDPVISSQGDDTNVNLQLTPKGTAIIAVGNSAESNGTTVAGGIVSVTSNVQRGKINVHGDAHIQAGSAVTIDLTNNKIGGDQVVVAGMGDNTFTTGTPFIQRVTSGAGSVTIKIDAVGATDVNGTVSINFIVL